MLYIIYIINCVYSFCIFLFCKTIELLSRAKARDHYCHCYLLLIYAREVLIIAMTTTDYKAILSSCDGLIFAPILTYWRRHRTWAACKCSSNVASTVFFFFEPIYYQKPHLNFKVNQTFFVNDLKIKSNITSSSSKIIHFPNEWNEMDKKDWYGRHTM